jgi:PBP1b-binding outer membrane lipoprotein LpoB
MKRMKMAGVVMMSLTAAALLGGCAGSYQARSVELKDVTMVDPALLKEGKDGQALYRYVNPNAEFKQYTKVLVDPVIIRKDGQLGKEEMADYQTLANNAYVLLTKELAKD